MYAPIWGSTDWQPEPRVLIDAVRKRKWTLTYKLNFLANETMLPHVCMLVGCGAPGVGRFLCTLCCHARVSGACGCVGVEGYDRQYDPDPSKKERERERQRGETEKDTERENSGRKRDKSKRRRKSEKERVKRKGRERKAHQDP